MARPRRRVARAAAVAGVLLGAGCATIPTSSSVHLGREIVGVSGLDDSDVRVLPPFPADGASPVDIVRGFLVASRSAEDDHGIARQFLTPRAGRRWSPALGVEVYDERALEVTLTTRDATRSVVTVTADRVGAIGPDGGYAPRTGELTLRLDVLRVDGQWRIDDPPEGQLLSTLDVVRSFRTADVYYLDPSEQVLVPDRVFLQAPRRGLPTALIRALLDGPTRWLAPAVRTAVPPGTHLVGNVPVNDGVADVDLSRDVLRATPRARAALSAQIVWSLRQLSEVTAVRVLADGTPLIVPGVGERQPRDAWATYSPDAMGEGATLFYVDGSLLRTGDGAVVDGPLGRGEVELDHPAVSPDGTRVAGITPSTQGVALLVGALRGRPTPRLSARAMTPPCFDRSGSVWTVTTRADGRQQVVLVSGSEVRTVPASGLFTGTVTALRLSRDGARVAAVVGSGATSRLVVGRVVRGRDGLSMSGFRSVLPGFTSVQGLAWGDAGHLLVLARPVGSANGRRLVVRVEPDGYTATALSRLDVDPESVAGAPGRPVLVGGGGQVWTSVLGVWQPVGRGTDPVYPD